MTGAALPHIESRELLDAALRAGPQPSACICAGPSFGRGRRRRERKRDYRQRAVRAGIPGFNELVEAATPLARSPTCSLPRAQRAVRPALPAAAQLPTPRCIARSFEDPMNLPI